MKKLYKVSAIIFSLFSIANSYAFNITLLLSNHTQLPIQTKGAISYRDENGKMVWDQATTPPLKIVPPKTNHIPQDKIEKNLQSYDLNYLEIYNEQGKYLDNCVDNYIALREDAIIEFDLYYFDNKFYCKRTIRYI